MLVGQIGDVMEVFSFSRCENHFVVGEVVHTVLRDDLHESIDGAERASELFHNLDRVSLLAIWIQHTPFHEGFKV